MKHTSHQFEDDLEKLKESLMLMGGMIESMLKEASEALINNNGELAARIIPRDNQLDQMEKRVDEQAIQILALRQPAATDLRMVTASMKICTDLERMGDIIVNICERIVELSKNSPLKPYKDLPRMMEATAGMITRAIDSYIRQSPELATNVLESDDEIDEYFYKINTELVQMMKASPDSVDRGLKLLFVAKSLERMADHATNIAEQVIFTVKGLDIRHSGRPAPAP